MRALWDAGFFIVLTVYRIAGRLIKEEKK